MVLDNFRIFEYSNYDLKGKGEKYLNQRKGSILRQGKEE